ncbi:nitroreductase family deazaflavin-dependent oxidoreductase [Mycobacterium kyorinense]|nr:nitroreductase family deazaflavin-dependent oxidoreductase [Mycobacterium kyorinense]
MDTNGVRAAAVAQLGKHRRLLRSGRSGRVLSALMLPMFKLSPSVGFGVLTTTGRKTGKPRSKCVRMIRRDDRVYIVALRPPHVAVTEPDVVHAWVRNIRANPAVQLRIPGGTFGGVAREITDAAELATARATICDTVNPVDYAECALHLRGWPTRAKIQELHRYWFDTGIPIVIELKETGA